MFSPARAILGALFVLAGINHFRVPDAYLQIMPPQLPFPRALIFLSGAAEIAGGIGIWLPPTRKLAAWGLTALLVAVFPANLYSLQSGLKIGDWQAPQWVLWARLPLQIPLIWWVWRCLEEGEKVSG